MSQPLARTGLVGSGLEAPPGAIEAAAASTSSATAAQYQHVQRQCPIPPSVQQQAFEPGTSRTCGVFGLGPGSPGPLGGRVEPTTHARFQCTIP